METAWMFEVERGVRWFVATYADPALAAAFLVAWCFLGVVAALGTLAFVRGAVHGWRAHRAHEVLPSQIVGEITMSPPPLPARWLN